MAPKKGSKKVAEDSEDLDINEEVEEPKPTKSATKPKATKEKNPPQENAKAKNSTAKKNSGANGKAKSKEDNKLLELIGDINVEHEVDPDELPTLINASYIDATTCGSSLTLCEHLVKLYFTLCRIQGEGDEAAMFVDCAAALTSPALRQNSSMEIQLITAMNLAEIFRIFAPEKPFQDDEQNLNVFKLFIDQLGRLELPGPHVDLVARLLQQLSSIQAFVMIIDDEKYLLKLFEMIFRVADADLPESVVVHLLDVLSVCIDECETIPVSLIDLILTKAVGATPTEDEEDAPRRNASAEAKYLAQQLIRVRSSVLQPEIYSFMNRLITESMDSELRHHHRIVIFVLFNIAPTIATDLLNFVLPELTCDDLTVRSSAIYLIGKVFTDSPESAHQNHALYDAFIGRFLDKNDDMRAYMIEFSVAFLKKDTSSQKSRALFDEIVKRTQDNSEIVREKAVAGVVDLLLDAKARQSNDIGRVDISDMFADNVEELYTRIRDRKPSVREKAYTMLNLLWELIQTYQPRALKNKPKHALFKLPTTYFNSFQIEPEFSIPFESHLTGLLSELHTMNPKRTWVAHFAHFYHYFSKNESALQRFEYYIKLKRHVFTLFKQYMAQRADRSSTKAKAAIESTIKSLADFLPDKSVEKFKKVVDQLKDTALFDGLTLLIDNNSDTKTIKKTLEMLDKKFKPDTKKTSAANYMRAIFTTLASPVVSRDTVIGLFTVLDHHRQEDQEEELESTLSLLKVLAKYFPERFSSCEVNVKDMIESQSESEQTAGKEILTTAAAHFSKSMRKMVPLAWESPEALVLSVKANTSFYSKPGQFKTIFAELEGYLNMKHAHSDKLESALLGLKELTTITQEMRSKANAVIGFITAELFLASADDAKRTKNDPLSQLVRNRAMGLKVIKTFLTRAVGEDKYLDDAFPEILDIITDMSPALVGLTPFEKNHLVYTAFCCVLRICRITKYAEKATPDIRKMANKLVTLSPDHKDEIAMRLNKHFMSSLMSVRFLALLALLSTEKQLRKKLLVAVVQKKRQWLKDNSSRLDDKDGDRQLVSLLPEYVLPWLIYILADLPSFHAEKEVDPPTYEGTCKHLQTYLDVISQGTSNHAFITKLLYDVKQLDVAAQPGLCETNIVAELALNILKHEKVRNGKAPSMLPAQVYLPNIFSVPQSKEKEETLIAPDKTFLPKGFRLPDFISGEYYAGLVDEDASRRRRLESGRKRRKLEQEEESDMEVDGKKTRRYKEVDESDDESSVVEQRKRKRRATAADLLPKRVETIDEEDEEEEKPKKRASPKKKAKDVELDEPEEEEEKPKKRASPQKKAKDVELDETEEEEKKPKKRTSPKKAKDVEEDELEEEEEEEKPKKRTTPKKAKEPVEEKPKPKRTPQKKLQAESDDEMEAEEAEEKPKPKRSRAKKVQSTAEDEEMETDSKSKRTQTEEEEGEKVKMKRVGPKRASSPKKVVEEESHESSESEAEKPAKKAGKRGGAKAVESKPTKPAKKAAAKPAKKAGK